jgi:uncharacterized protein YejL (UPF0352 family)
VPVRARWGTGLIALSLLALTPASATQWPTPGTSAQVAQLVAASTSITTVPSNLVPSLSSANHDNVDTFYPKAANTCPTPLSCVFGDTSSPNLVVLYGDSHAQMWLPALIPVAQSDKFRLALVWHPGCPDTDVTTSWAVCSSFRTSAISAINASHPSLVLLGNKTTNVVGPRGTSITNAQWEKGLETTISHLSQSGTKVAVIGDITSFDASVPACIAAYPTHVQHCTVPNPNPKFTQRFSVESAAAKVEGVPYLNPQPWLCKTKCSPIVGNMVTYWDQGHVAATYAEFLTNLWANALKDVVPPPPSG